MTSTIACDKCGGFVLRVEEDEIKCVCCAKRTWKAWPIQDALMVKLMKHSRQKETN